VRSFCFPAKAHGNNVDAAIKSMKDYFGGVYGVSRMVEDHIDLLTSANGYTIRRYWGNLECHIADGLGAMDAAQVEYRDIVRWLKEMQVKGLSSKTIANVHGLISAASIQWCGKRSGPIILVRVSRCQRAATPYVSGWNGTNGS
jgi:hypothetical protein